MPECHASLDGKHHFATRPSGTDARTGRSTDSHMVCVCGLAPDKDALGEIRDGLSETARVRALGWGTEKDAKKLPLL